MHDIVIEMIITLGSQCKEEGRPFRCRLEHSTGLFVDLPKYCVYTRTGVFQIAFRVLVVDLIHMELSVVR